MDGIKEILLEVVHLDQMTMVLLHFLVVDPWTSGYIWISDSGPSGCCGPSGALGLPGLSFIHSNVPVIGQSIADMT